MHKGTHPAGSLCDLCAPQTQSFIPSLSRLSSVRIWHRFMFSRPVVFASFSSVVTQGRARSGRRGEFWWLVSLGEVQVDRDETGRLAPRGEREGGRKRAWGGGTEEESRRCHTGGGSYLRGEKSPQALANKCLARNVSLLGFQWG